MRNCYARSYVSTLKHPPWIARFNLTLTRKYTDVQWFSCGWINFVPGMILRSAIVILHVYVGCDFPGEQSFLSRWLKHDK